MGPYQIEPMLDRAEEQRGTVYRVVIGPHNHTATSYHKVAEEYYYVLAGAATAVLDDRPVALAAGDFLRLPPGTRHAFITADSAVEMLNMHVPGCWPDRDTYFPNEPPPAGFSPPADVV